MGAGSYIAKNVQNRAGKISKSMFFPILIIDFHIHFVHIICTVEIWRSAFDWIGDMKHAIISYICSVHYTIYIHICMMNKIDSTYIHMIYMQYFCNIHQNLCFFFKFSIIRSIYFGRIYNVSCILCIGGVACIYLCRNLNLKWCSISNRWYTQMRATKIFGWKNTGEGQNWENVDERKECLIMSSVLTLSFLIANIY